MKSVVIDANLAAKWFLPEKGSKAAIRFAGTFVFWAPACEPLPKPKLVGVLLRRDS